MNENVCPKCGAEPVPDEGQNPPPIGYVCGSMPRIFAGGFHQDDKCRIRELEAENARLRALLWKDVDDSELMEEPRPPRRKQGRNTECE